MARISGVQKDLFIKEGNSIPSKGQSPFAENPQELKKKNDGIVGSMKSSLQAESTGKIFRSGFTFNSAKGEDEDRHEPDSNLDNGGASNFFCHKDRSSNRPAVGPLSKPAPTKWDDAQKWLINTPSIHNATLKSKPKSGAIQVAQVFNSQAAQNPTKKPLPGAQVRQSGNVGGINAPRTVACSIICNSPGTLESLLSSGRINSDGRGQLPDDASKISVEFMKELDISKNIREQAEATSKFSFVSSENQLPKSRTLPNPIDRYPLNDALQQGHGESKDVCLSSIGGEHEILKPTIRIQKPNTEFLTRDFLTLDFNRSDLSCSPHEASKVPLPSLRSVSMRDMGTEMTPITSQEPSRTGTPNRSFTPILRSPISSHPSTPGRATPVLSPKHQDSIDNGGLNSETELKLPELSEKELQIKTRQEILALGTQLGKTNIAAWATQDEEDADASKSLKTTDLEEVQKNVIETRAAAWEEAQRATYMARYRREEVKIQAWENHEKAKIEAEMRCIEVNIERIRSHAHEKLMKKLAAARRRSDEMRASAEARRGEQAAKTMQHADVIRHTGKLPSSFEWRFCCP